MHEFICIVRTCAKTVGSGLDIRHEGVGADGACGWPFVSNIIDDRMKIRSIKNSRFILNNINRQERQRYRVVLHQVRIIPAHRKA